MKRAEASLVLLLGILFISGAIPLVSYATAGSEEAIGTGETPGGQQAADRERVLLDKLGSIACQVTETSSLLGERGTYRIIKREEIIAYGFSSIEEALVLVPGLQVHAQSATEKAASVRGLGNALASGLLVTIDGARVNLDQTGAADWGNLPVTIDNVERIEVVRGPHPSVGTSMAFAGAINIVTRRIDAPSHLDFSAGAGSHGWESGAASIRGRLGPGPVSAGYQLSASWDSESPWRDEMGEPSRELRRMRGQLDFSLPRIGVAIIDGWTNGGTHETSFGPTLGRVISDTRDHHARLLLTREASRLEFIRDWGDKDGTTLDLAFPFPVSTAYRRSLVSFQQQNQQTDRVLARWGGVYEQSDVESFLLSAPWQEETWALFLDYQVIPREGWSVSLNARYDHFQPLGGKIDPRVSVSYQATPRWRFWGSWGESFRNPTVGELTTSLTLPSQVSPTLGEFPIITQGFDRLKHERIQALEVGSATAVGKESTLEFVFFRHRTDDLIWASLEETYDSPPAPVPGMPALYTYRNLGSTHSWGAESELTFGLGEKWRGLMSASYTNAHWGSDGSRVEEIPRWHLLGGLRWNPYPALSLAFLGSYTTEHRIEGQKLPAFGVGNVRVGFRPPWAGGELSLAALNVLDREHQEAAGGDWIGRRLLLSWRTEY